GGFRRDGFLHDGHIRGPVSALNMAVHYNRSGVLFHLEYCRSDFGRNLLFSIKSVRQYPSEALRHWRSGGELLEVSAAGCSADPGRRRIPPGG
ncbi:TPA: hypothetical protein ACSQFI_006476, partial [Pseudomonas aeruginosa]